MKIITILGIPSQNYENHEISRIPCQNQENHEDLIIQRQNHENHEILRIPHQNYENHEIHRIPHQNSKNYENSCECARINEIVNGIGGKTVIIIRYNPDIVRNKDKILNINKCDKLDLLVKIIKEELVKNYEIFLVNTEYN